MLETLFGSYTAPILIGLAIVLVIVILNKFPNGKIFVFTFLGICLIASSIYSTINIIDYYNAEGGVYGEISESDSPNDVLQNETTFEFKNIMLTQSDGDLYEARFQTDSVVQLSADEKYEITVNNLPCKYIVHSKDYVICEYKYNFYDESFDSILDNPDTIQFKIAFYEKYTYLIVSTNGGSDAITCWNDYFNKNNFVLKIEASDSVYIPEANYNKVSLVSLGKTTEVDVLKNYTFELPQVEDTETKHFLGWSTNDGATYIESVTPTSDLTINAIWEEKIKVTFNLNDDSLDGNSNLYFGSDYYIKNTVINFPEYTHRHFLGWSTDKETVIDTSNVLATEDVIYYAVYDETETVTLKLNGGSLVFLDNEITSDTTLEVLYDEKIIFSNTTKTNSEFYYFEVYINSTTSKIYYNKTLNKSLEEIYKDIIGVQGNVYGSELPEIEYFEIVVNWLTFETEEKSLCYEIWKQLGLETIKPFNYTNTQNFYKYLHNCITGEDSTSLTNTEVKNELSEIFSVEYKEDDIEFLTSLKNAAENL